MESRLKTLILIFLASLLTIGGKLFYWQVVKHKELSSLAAEQYFTQREIPAERGKIYSQDNFPLVLNTKAYLLYGNPQKVSFSLGELAAKLKPVVEIKEERIIPLWRQDLVWVPMVRNLSEEAKAKIEALSLDGLGFEQSDKRFYPEASLAAQLLGFVGLNSEGKDKGYFGLEGYYNHELKGKEGRRFFEQDALGRPIPLSQGSEISSIPGRDLYLNLDRSIQFFSEKYLAEGLRKTGAHSGWVVVLDPQTGAVLAMASRPTFDPARYWQADTEHYSNPIISSVFEPGSIFKVIAMASALDAGAVRPGEICTKCAGPRQIADYTIKTWNEKYYPGSNLTDIIVHSDNVGMVYVVEKLGLNRFFSYIKSFGFGQKTGIDLQGELEAPLKPKENWREIDVATASFGQGIAVSPIQMVTAVAAIANGGVLYQPQVVRQIADPERQIKISPVEKGRVISQRTAELVREMMIEMVEQNNTRQLKPRGYQVAGKSGTAQIPAEGRYSTDRTIASFVGFAPAHQPQFVMLVTLKEPKSSVWAEATAAPVWFNIAREIFRLRNIEPAGS